MTEHDAADVQGLVTALRERVEVSPAPVHEVMRRGAARRTQRRRALYGGLAAAVAASVLGIAAVTVTRGDDRVVTPAPPVGVPWWGDDRLHLDGKTISIGGVTQLVEVPGGVVVFALDRAVERVDFVKGRSLVGKHWPPSGTSHVGRLLVDDSTGHLAWLSRSPKGRQTIQVVELAASPGFRQVSTHEIDTAWPDAVQLRAFEDGVVYYDQRDGGDRAWHIDTGEVDQLGTGASYVMDVEGDMMLTMRPDGSAYDLRAGGVVRWSTTVQASSWQFSPDGRWLVGRQEAGVRLLDTLTGNELVTGLPPGADVVAVSPRLDGTIMYAVGDTPDGPLDLVECNPDSATCETLLEDAASDPDIVLPEDLPPVS